MPSNKHKQTKVKENDKREIGNLAVWSLSSAKPGFGVQQLRDDNIETYWQSDGPQPHMINIQFPRKMEVEEIEFYTDFKLDESYTPHHISIKSGTNYHDLKEIKFLELEEANGWISFNFKEKDENSEKYLNTNFIQVGIVQNHQNGRDTHLRQLKIYGPKKSTVSLFNNSFSNLEYTQFETLR